jgi:hypothetical protein
MSVANPGEFLTELDAQEAYLVLHNCFTQNSELMMKNDIDPQPVQAKIDSFANNKLFLNTPNVDRVSLFIGLTSIKFFIGTEVYFIKTEVKIQDNAPYIDQNVKIVQLKRRKEPRFNIPEKWSQKAAVWSIEKKIKNDARVIDISNGGIKFEIPKLTIPIIKGEQIRIQYQIFKRAEVVCDAVVRFILQKPNGTALLGLEFTQLQKSHKSRISSIVEDLENYYELQNQL